MAARGMLKFPEFFKVGVSIAGNHDQRLFWHSWGERYQGLPAGDNYLEQANLTHAANLEGKLLFIHGMLDFGVHPGGLFQLTQALMDANKVFDLVLLPQTGHALPGYGMVRMWDYFVRHLGGMEPPPGFSAKSSSDRMMEQVKTIQMAAMAQPEAPPADDPAADEWGPAVRVTLETDAGDIALAVYPEAAPASAGSFLEHVDQGLFDGGAFYRVVRRNNDNGSPVIEVVQGGLTDPSKALPPVPHETTEQTGIRHLDGTLVTRQDRPRQRQRRRVLRHRRRPAEPRLRRCPQRRRPRLRRVRTRHLRHGRGARDSPGGSHGAHGQRLPAGPVAERAGDHSQGVSATLRSFRTSAGP